MNQSSLSNDSNTQQVYGFLCPNTNVFYAFDSYEVYQQFISWLAQQETPVATNLQSQERTCSPMISQADQLEDYERATNEIMGVFNDPVFERMDEDVELQEIDF